MSDIDQLGSKHRVAESEEEIDSGAEGESCRGGESGRRRRGKHSSSLDRRFHSRLKMALRARHTALFGGGKHGKNIKTQKKNLYLI